MDIHFFRAPSDDTLNGSHEKAQAYLDTTDEVVNKTNWTPLVSGGISIKTRRLVKVGNDRIVLKTTARLYILFMLFIAVGCFTMFLAFYGEGNGNPILVFLIGLVLFMIGIYLLLRQTKKITLDNHLKAMWQGKENPAKMINPSGIDGYVSLNKLHAVQILKELVENDTSDDESGFSTKNNDYFSYEINLIMNDGKRINIVDNAHKQSINTQAYAIADLFKIPVWDACNIYDNESPGGGISLPAFVTRALQAYDWFKIVVVIGVSIIVLWSILKDHQAVVEEEKKIISFSPQEKLALSQESTRELMELIKHSKASLPMIGNLVRKGALIDEKDELGRTPLFYAVENRIFDYVSFFVRAGADIHIVDNNAVGLKDLLDPVKDKLLYFYLVDTELDEEAAIRGKRVISIDRKFDQQGKLIYQKVHEK